MRRRETKRGLGPTASCRDTSHVFVGHNRSRQIELLDLVALFVFEDPPHRWRFAGIRPHQIDIVYGPERRFQLPALRRVESIEAPDLQPATVVVADINAI